GAPRTTGTACSGCPTPDDRRCPAARDGGGLVEGRTGLLPTAPGRRIASVSSTGGRGRSEPVTTVSSDLPADRLFAVDDQRHATVVPEWGEEAEEKAVDGHQCLGRGGPKQPDQPDQESVASDPDDPKTPFTDGQQFLIGHRALIQRRDVFLPTSTVQYRGEM